MRIDAVIFDLDGTLIDTQELILASFRVATAEVLGQSVPDDEVVRYIGIPLIDQARILAPEHIDELMERYRRHNLALHDELIRYFEGTREMLEGLAQRGKLLAVVTSKRNRPAREGLDSFGLRPFFTIILGMEDTVKHKPDPEPLLEAARRLKVDPTHCVYVGDSIYDMQSARSAGMGAIAALWGMHSAEQLRDAGAQYEASNPAEVCPLIDTLCGSSST